MQGGFLFKKPFKKLNKKMVAGRLSISIVFSNQITFEKMTL
jgi:hypothetical protein